MNDEQLLRYSRHILLPQIGIEGQERLLAARALMIGAGGLGSPAALYLAAAGIGTLVLCDDDTVDLTNLQRQILHYTASVGRPKALSGRDTLALINPEVNVVALERRLEGELLDEQVAAAVNAQVDELLSKLPLLAEAHGVRHGDWFALVVSLARTHVPGFKLVEPAGRPTEWGMFDKAEF